jgi:hypothetical protein
VRLAGALAGVVLVIAVAALAPLWSRWRSDVVARASVQEPAVPASWERPPVSAAGLVQQSGVRVVQVAVTGAGGLLDLRFQVVDPDRAAAVHDPATPPALVDESTGLVVDQLLMGHSHSGGYQTGVSYYLVFENPGNLVHRGALVSVLLGDAQVEHVVVK